HYLTPLRSALHPLPLHDALPISEHAILVQHHYSAIGQGKHPRAVQVVASLEPRGIRWRGGVWHRREVARISRVHGNAVGSQSIGDRKSTRLNSSHDQISYAVFCL